MSCMEPQPESPPASDRSGPPAPSAAPESEHDADENRGDGNDATDDPHLAQMSRSDLQDLFKRDSSVRLQIPAKPTPETAAVRLACLALRQAGQWGPPAYDVDVPHPRFAEAVAAAAAAPDEEQALAAATAVLEGPEALAAFGLDAPGPEADPNPSDGRDSGGDRGCHGWSGRRGRRR